MARAGRACIEAGPRCRAPCIGGPGPAALARRARATWPHRVAVGSVHIWRCFRFALVLWWRCRQAHHRPVGAAAHSNSIGAAGKTGTPSQLSPPTAQRTVAKAVLPQATPPVQTTPQDVRPTASPVAPGLTQLLQTMARDLANMQQGIEQRKGVQEKMASDNAKAVDELKAGQEKMASDNAKAVDELKAGQEQMTQLIAKVSEQNPKPSAPPPRPVASPTRRPVPTHPSP